jgi:hypothetical protein
MSTDRPAPPPTRDARPSTREQRLAAKLRENLHRRKAQARAQSGNGPVDSPGDGHAEAETDARSSQNPPQ